MSGHDWSAAWFAALLSALVFAAAPVRADELQDINGLLKQGQHAQALDRINQYLAQRPRDAQGRFLKGLILVEEGKVTEAIDVFTKLSRDYPELPEPFNNLAVLYAEQGQYEKARQQLELSIHTHPSYATAYENLGDVYTKLASQAYDKALQLDSSNSDAKSKLSLIHELISSTNRPPRPAGRPAEIALASPPPSTVTSTPKSAPEVKPSADQIKPGPANPVEQPPKGQDESRNDVLKTLSDWAAAWSKQDSGGYLSFYAKDFKTPKGEARTEWEAARTKRISAPKKIEITVRSPRVTFTGTDAAVVTFRQVYRSDQLSTNGTKTLVMIRIDRRWLIQEERMGS
jgi:tetratricopeptide (TPR) repeat protein